MKNKLIFLFLLVANFAFAQLPCNVPAASSVSATDKFMLCQPTGSRYATLFKIIDTTKVPYIYQGRTTGYVKFDGTRWVIDTPSGGGGASIEDDSVLTTKTWSSDKIYYRDLTNIAAVVACTTAQNLAVQTIQGLTPSNALLTAQASSADNGFYSWSGSAWVKIPETATFNTGRTLFTVQDGDLEGYAFIADPALSNYTFRMIGGGSGGGGSGTVTSVSGTTDRITVATGTTTPVIDIASTYVGQSSIQTVGNITSGAWLGTVIGSNYGGAGTITGLLKANGSGVVSAAVAGTDYVIPSALTGYFPITGGTLTGTGGNGYFGGLAQSSAPSYPAFGTDGTRMYFDAIGRVASVRRYGVSRFITNEDDEKNIIGQIINDVYDRPNASLGYSVTGANATFSIPGTNDRLTVTNTTKNTLFAHYAVIPYQTWLRSWEVCGTLTTTNAASDGIAFGGLDEDAGNGVVAKFNAQTGSTTFELLSSGIGTVKATSPTVLTFSTSDVLKVCFIKDGYRFTAKTLNVTTGLSVEAQYSTDLGTASSDALNRRNRVTIFSLGGTQNITNLTVSSKEKRNNEIVFVADSRGWGFKSGCDFTNTDFAITGNTIVGGATTYNASGGKLTQFVNLVSDAAQTVRKGGYMAIALGVNDAATSVSQVDFATAVSSVNTQCLALGIIPIWSTVIQTSGGLALITNYNNNVILPLSTTNGMHVVDEAAGLGATATLSGLYNTDGTHLTTTAYQIKGAYYTSQTPYIRRVAYNPNISKSYSGANLVNGTPSFSVTNTATGQGNGTSTSTEANIGVFSGSGGIGTIGAQLRATNNSGGTGQYVTMDMSASSPYRHSNNGTEAYRISTGGLMTYGGTGNNVGLITVAKSYTGATSLTSAPFVIIRNESTSQGDNSTTTSSAGLRVEANNGGITGRFAAVYNIGSTKISLSSNGTAPIAIESASSGTAMQFNTAGDVFIGSSSTSATLANFYILQAVQTSSFRPLVRIDGALNTGVTASTEATEININLDRVVQHATGALTLQRDVRFRPATHSFVAASSLTDLIGFSAEAPVAGGNNNTTNLHAFHIPAKACTTGSGTVVNSYAITANAQTGATNNYAAQFVGGLGVFMSDVNIVLGTTTGTKIGTSTSQKLAFYNSTPIVQPTTAITAAAFVANTSSTVDDSATFGGYTIGQVVAALKALGLIQ